jgi:hypothetical protein
MYLNFDKKNLSPYAGISQIKLTGFISGIVATPGQ